MGEFSLIRVLPQPDPPQERSVPEARPWLPASGPVRPPALPNPGAESPSVLRIESGGATVWLVDHQLRLLAGPRPEHAAGVTLYELYKTRDPEHPMIRAHRLALAGRSVSFELEQEGRLWEVRVEPSRDSSGAVTGGVGLALDVTERRRTAEELSCENELLKATLASIGDGVIRTDAEGRIDSMNPVAERLTGWSTADALGRPVAEIFQVVDEVTRTPIGDPVRRCLDEGKVVESPGHALLIAADGRESSVRDSAAPIRGQDGKVIGAVVVFKDVTQLRGMEREMIYLASHDALTGLLNRREFEVRLKRAIRTSRAEQRHHVLLYLDLDEFKAINDTCGHLVGDEMLKQITALLRSRVRRSDTLARLGGDEFGVLLEDCPLDHARQIAEDIRRSVREFRFRWRDQMFSVGVSIGFVAINGDSGDIAQVMGAGDAACYVAKEGGKNRVHEHELDDTTMAERSGEMQWIHRIHGAFEDHRFRLYYQLVQPISENAGRELLCEVFLRMLDSNGDLVQPSSFIAAAERYKLIGSLDRWVVRTAFRALAEAQRREVSRPVLFAINISAQALAEESFLTYIIEELEKSSVDPRRVCFEITETAAISKLDSAMRFIAGLKAKGCRFILDDFGSGLSSFAYLRDLQIDYLKIDGEFVQSMLEDRVKRAMVESINQVGHALGIQTIAEWVENRQTLEVLKELGVDYAQGYWLCRPQPLVHDVE
jgi:diguanylate cyclase (GGDEF)-like protein/PAS domain S-box-containing protein